MTPQDDSWGSFFSGICPICHFLPLTYFLLISNTLVFIFLVVQGTDSSPFLSVKTHNLIKYGANLQSRVKIGEVYRLVTALFLHMNFMHILGNLIVTALFVSRIEYLLGPAKTIAIYLLAGISGNLVSIAIVPEPIKAGASTALFGIVGLMLGYLILNWRALSYINGSAKAQFYCSAIMILVFLLMFTPSTNDSSVDHLGHFGGFLAGVWLAAIPPTLLNAPR